MSPTFTPLSPLTPVIAVGTMLWRPARLVRRWPIESQARSRRNALVANSALTARRLEREEVELFLRSLGSGRITA